MAAGTAVALTARGHEVIATARDVASLDDVPAALRLSLDVTDQASVDAAIARAGRVDVLVSNAGATVRAPLETVPLDEVQSSSSSEHARLASVAQAVLPGCGRRAAGQIIFVSSIQGRLSPPADRDVRGQQVGTRGAGRDPGRRAGALRHLGARAAARGGGVRRRRAAPVYLDDANPYRPLLGQDRGFRAAPITVEEVADAVAETVDQAGKAAFRIPIGEIGQSGLAARKAAPEDTPFLTASLDW